jgi:hypothetical protein
MILKNKRHYDHFRKFDIHQMVPSEIIFEIDDTQRANNIDIDLLITFTQLDDEPSFGDIARLGNVVACYSDERVYRGGPPGFWEVYFREDVTGFGIHHVARGFHRILLQGRTATQFYYLLNQASISEKLSFYLVKVVGEIASTGKIPAAQRTVPFCYVPRNIPTVAEMLCYLAGVIRISGSKTLRSIRGYDVRWHVGFVRNEDWREAELWRATVLDNPKGHYLADPFVIEKNGSVFCFVEDFDESAGRGKITVFSLGSKPTFVGTALEEDFHLSYPYIFEYDGALYMCPESSAAREIRIYKCLQFPLNWKLEKVIMKNISAVDTMLLEKDGRWWMLTNVNPAGWDDDFPLELCIFSAHSPLAESWVPHPLNPICIDPCERNGGFVKEGLNFFRVAQSQGFGMLYGKRTSVNQIVELGDSKYVEKSLCTIEPSFGKAIVGTHHFNATGEIIVFDFAVRHEKSALSRCDS